MARNPFNQRGLSPLTEGEVGWLAGIFEGEGYCGLKGHTGFSVEITMTDLDVVDRIGEITGVGKISGPFEKGHRPYKIWRVGSGDGVEFLEAILPWLGERRSERAREAVRRWKNDKKQTRPEDTHCINGHEFTPENTFYPYKGTGRGCKTCRQAALKKYREKRKDDPVLKAKYEAGRDKRNAKARRNYLLRKTLESDSEAISSVRDEV